MKHEEKPIDWIEWLKSQPKAAKEAKEAVKGRQADGEFKTKNEGIW